jgi:nucleoside-diphosphate-sugar epimerase
MQITVLGGSGFIGTRLVAALLDVGHAVRIFDKAPSATYPALVTLGDVRDAQAVALALQGCACVFDLAAEHRDDVHPASLYFDVNVGGARNTVRAAVGTGVRRIVFASSVAVYGLDQPMADEASPLRPSSDYARSKADAEAVYADWASASPGSRSLLLVRPTVVFGEGNRGNVFTLIEQLRRGRFAMVGNGANRKSMAYVGNLVDFLVTQIDAAPGVVPCNYADKPDLSMHELVAAIDTMLPGHRAIPRVPRALALAGAGMLDLLARLRGRPFPVSRSRIRKFCADTTVATPVLDRTGFRPTLGLDTALRRTVTSVLSDAR